jgi:hypothetical protein
MTAGYPSTLSDLYDVAYMHARWIRSVDVLPGDGRQLSSNLQPYALRDCITRIVVVHASTT